MTLTEDQKAWRRHERRAAAETAKARDEAGMFADVPGQVQVTTAEQMYWRWRQNKALAAENLADVAGSATRGLLWIKLQAIERWATELLGPALAGPLIAHVRRVYPMPSYGPPVWANLLSGNYELVYGYRLEFRPEYVNQYNSDGRRLVAEQETLRPQMRIVDLHTYRGPFIYCGRRIPFHKLDVVKVDSPLRNPYSLKRYGNQALPMFRTNLFWQLKRESPAVVAALLALTEDSILGCWCVDLEGQAIFTEPEVCHCQIIAKAHLWLKEQGDD